jgi:anaerobic magnesium-protoporphyrin IX monomethyl ester cyclase
MGKFKVLFISPNHDTEPRIPLGIAILVSCLKNIGAEVRLLDTTFMCGYANVTNRYKEEKGLVEKSDMERYYGEPEVADLDLHMAQLIEEFDPDLVAMSLVEHNFALGMRLLKRVKECTSVPTMVGGILPIIQPEMVIEQEPVDMVCVGEGEDTIAEIVARMRENRPVDDLKNLWVKHEDGVRRNQTGPLVDLNRIPYQDWDLFDERCLYKAFMGKVYRCGSFEMSRGCLKRCAFCVAPAIRNAISRNHQYQRWKTPERLVEEIAFFAKRYRLELVHFCDTNFLLGLDIDYLMRLSRLYTSRIGLPFLIQTGADTIKEENVSILKEMGCVTMSVGVESVNADIRKRIMKKQLSDRTIEKAFNLARKYDIRTTANYILGLPYETEEDVWESIRFNNRLAPPSIAVHYFVPFLGTELYDLCVKQGFYSGFDPGADVYRESPLETPTLSKQRINELLHVFVEEYQRNKM